MKKIIVLISIILAGYYLNNESYSIFKNDVKLSDIYAKVASSKVSSKEVKPALINLIIQMCEVNGVDIRNGFGTVEQCLGNFEVDAEKSCFDKIHDFEGKVYSTKPEIKADVAVYLDCVTDYIWIYEPPFS